MGTRPNQCQFREAPPYDSTVPLLPPSSHYTVPPPPPPLVQSTPQVGAFVLHGQTKTTPHFVMAPTQVTDDTDYYSKSAIL